MYENALFSGKIHTDDKNFTSPSVVAFMTNINSVWYYWQCGEGVGQGEEPQGGRCRQENQIRLPKHLGPSQCPSQQSELSSELLHSQSN